jgi:hypothetical protein
VSTAVNLEEPTSLSDRFMYSAPWTNRHYARINGRTPLAILAAFVTLSVGRVASD